MKSSGSLSSSLPNELDEISYQKILEAHTAIDFLLEDLEKLLGQSYNYDVLSLYEDLKVIRSILTRLQGTSNHHPKFSSMVKKITDVAGKFFSISSPFLPFVLKHSPEVTDVLSHSARVAALVEEIKSVEKETVAFLNGQNFHQRGNASDESSFRENGSSSLDGEIVVGFDEEARDVEDRLLGGWEQLDVITITGMAGIGKTTLAKRLYNDPSIVCHFHKRAWTSVSQKYQKRKLLQDLLSCLLTQRKPNLNKAEEYLEEELYKCLKGKRYLIVIDDIWDIEAWHDLEIYFPEDDNSSRILMTSRIKDVPLAVGHHDRAYTLRFLTVDESWDLFQRKIFLTRSCPQGLMEIGKEIVTKCKGLPLAIVVIAGLLAKQEKTQERWRLVATNIGSSITTNSGQFMDTLAMSYTHLPSSLKSCFLYLGTFPEDYEVPARQLIMSWIAEGFVQPTRKKRLEEVSEDYLINLVDRSLVIVGKRRSDGGIKSCYIHDMLRDLCLVKARDKKFMQGICNCKNAPSSGRLDPNFVPSLSDCQYFHFDRAEEFVDAYRVFTSQAVSVYKRLRTLNLSQITLDVDEFPHVLLLLVHLKFMALQVYVIYDIPPSICTLENLETFILFIHKTGTVILPSDIWKMVKLRHLKVSHQLVFDDPGEHFSRNHSGNPLIYSPRRQLGQTEGLLTILKDSFQSILQVSPSAADSTISVRTTSIHHRRSIELEASPQYVLYNLQTISKLRLSDLIRNFLPRTPNLRKLAFSVLSSQRQEAVSFPNLSSLSLLEALKLECGGHDDLLVNIPHPNDFPPFLKKLTLSGPCFKWEEITFLGLLPNLEVLKIEINFSSGKWETSDDGFCQLRFLKLSQIGLSEWITTCSHFPRLERLVLHECFELKEIPLDIGDIFTLQTVEVYDSSNATVEWAKEVQESQSIMGNEDLKVIISDAIHVEESYYPAGY